MFGIVRPVTSMLSEEDKATFKGYYCGICKSIARRYTSMSRMTLSFDCTFLAILLDGISGEENKLNKGKCTVKSIDYIDNKTVDVCADINILLMYYKLLDDVNDDNSTKARLAKAVLKNAFNKAKANNPEIEAIIKSNLDYLYTLEKDGCDDIDEVSDAFACILSGIMGVLCESSDAVQIGYNLGRYIYLLDAFMDYEEDVKKNRYNVFYKAYGKVDDLDKKANFTLEYTLSKISEHLQNIEFVKNKALIDNVLYAGIVQYFIKNKGEK